MREILLQTYKKERELYCLATIFYIARKVRQRYNLNAHSAGKKKKKKGTHTSAPNAVGYKIDMQYRVFIAACATDSGVQPAVTRRA